MIRLAYAVYSSCGVRPRNEDTAAVIPMGNTLLAVAADGLGGHESGDRASQCAVETVKQELSGKTFSTEAVAAAIDRANRAVYDLLGGRGLTTLAMVWIENDLAITAGIGDTRIYIFRKGEIEFRSVDHSMAALSVFMGDLKEEEIRTSPDRNRLYRTLGGEQSVKPELHKMKLCPGDRLLLCSDGLWEPVTESRMLELSQANPQTEDWLAGLRHEAEGRSKDNHTGIVIDIL